MFWELSFVAMWQNRADVHAKRNNEDDVGQDTTSNLSECSTDQNAGIGSNFEQQEIECIVWHNNEESVSFGADDNTGLKLQIRTGGGLRVAPVMYVHSSI